MGHSNDEWPSSRRQAKGLGITGYFTGKACPQGHIAVRDTANGQCRGCKAIIRHNYWVTHKEVETANHKLWVGENREQWNMLQREWSRLNPEKSNEITRNKTAKKPELYKLIKRRSAHKIYHKDIEKGREKGRLANHIRRTRIEGNGGTFTLQDIENIHRWQKGTCYWCKKRYGNNFHIDHIWPVSKGGSSAPENLCLTCPSCNLIKNIKTPMEFAGRLF